MFNRHTYTSACIRVYNTCAAAVKSRIVHAKKDRKRERGRKRKRVNPILKNHQHYHCRRLGYLFISFFFFCCIKFITNTKAAPTKSQAHTHLKARNNNNDNNIMYYLLLYGANCVRSEPKGRRHLVYVYTRARVCMCVCVGDGGGRHVFTNRCLPRAPGGFVGIFIYFIFFVFHFLNETRHTFTYRYIYIHTIVVI